ncbi:hypothetical protein DPMN_033827 [Dreissena polymorpha]|uniref:B box-type domain-containing protein n=1 Tax=Dreissena polymorpha TaxID=45954 RepID=A0A9D4M7D3_DREPO|nr:hypothetical protein DPMN_033827 [Dreissena polymorpha]
MATRRLQDSNRDNAGDFIGECAVTQSCEPCMKTNISKTATVFCKDCDEFLCDACKNPHIVYKPGKHDIAIIQDRKSVRVVVDMEGMDMCPEHGKDKKKIEFYCKDHSKFCCIECRVKHKKCDSVEKLADATADKWSELHALKQALLTLESGADAIIAECKHSETGFNESIAKISSEVDKMRDRIIQLFDQAKQKLLTEAKDFKTAEIKRIGNKRDTSSKVKEEINKVVPMCCAVLERGTPTQQYICSKMIKEKLLKMESKINEQKQIKIASTVKVSFLKELTSLLEMGKNFVKLNSEGDKTGIVLVVCFAFDMYANVN